VFLRVWRIFGLERVDIMGKLEMKKLVLGSVGTNCYIIWNKETKEAVVVDPADSALTIREAVLSQGLSLKAVLLTHGHFDHIYAVNDLLRTFHVPVYCHEDEKEVLQDPALNLSSMMGSHGSISVEAANSVKDGEVLDLIGEQIQVIHTPGHTKGGACYYFTSEDKIFVGDTVFMESVGRTDFPTGNGPQLIHSIITKLYPLKDSIQLYPGHGPSTSIAYEKENNPYTSGEIF